MYKFLCLLLASMLAVGVDAADIVVSKADANALPPAQIGIAPPEIKREVVLQTGAGGVLNESIIIYNYSDRPKVISLHLVDTDASGQVVAPNDSTLLPRLIINPTEFTIPADAHQTIRLSLRLGPDFRRGKHYAKLLIEQNVDQSLQVNEQDQSITLSIGSSYGLPLVIDVK